MTSRGLGLVVAAALAFALGGVSIAACVGDEPSNGGGGSPDATTTPTATTTSTTPPPSPGANGAGCVTDDQCASKHCVDKVCCESACNGECERCNDANALGKCSAIAAGTDPESECVAPTLDAGADAAGDPDGGDSGAADPDAATVPSLLLPDGGVPLGDDTACAPKCNGSRKCALPTAETSCGAKFCTEATVQAAARCDGQGRCLYGTEDCTTGVCPAGGAGCNTTCTLHTDCLGGSYCDGTSCKPMRELGVPCASSPQCKSGFCQSNVCCETACDGTCNGQGKCTCSACTTGPCALFYEDKDKDGYGDKEATLQNGHAKFACADAAVTGYSKNNLDCYDGTRPPEAADPKAALVHPGAGFQTQPFTIGTSPTLLWDYDCSGSIQKEHLETGKACYLCGLSGRTCGGLPLLKCGALTTEQFSHQCSLNKLTGSCDPNPKALSSYDATVACGDSALLYTCGGCNKGASVPGTSVATTQGCR